jgi:PqqD family protein of HPr-rel-A system
VLDDEAVVYDPDTGRLHRLNATATAVWSCCDGRRSVASVVAAIAESFRTTPATIEADVLRVLDDWESAGLLAFGERDQTPGSDALGPSASPLPSPPTKRRIE